MSILEQVDLSLALTPGAYAEQLAHYQPALDELTRLAVVQRRPIVILFEGWEAAGQGAAIQRITERLDPHGYVVYANAPSEEDAKAYHYLYRFWQRLPARGEVAIFDGSWYARVLAGRVERLCTPADWQRAYREIDQFERQLVDFGTIIIKFWLHISLDVQSSRLRSAQAAQAADQARAPFAAEDARHRASRAIHEAAVEEMLLKTSTLLAPWKIVEANDALWAQIQVLRTVVEVLAQELDYVLEHPDAGSEAMDAPPAQESVRPGRGANHKRVKQKSKGAS